MVTSLVMGSDDSVSGVRPETDQPTPILKGPKPTEDRIITDRTITNVYPEVGQCEQLIQ